VKYLTIEHAGDSQIISNNNCHNILKFLESFMRLLFVFWINGTIL